MYIDKAEIVSVLRSGGLDARADWVDRALPEFVDTYRNAALLHMLGIDLATMSSVDIATRPGQAAARSPNDDSGVPEPEAVPDGTK